MFFCLFVFVFSTFGTFFCSYEHIFQIRLVTVKRKVILSYHKKLCCWSPQRFSRFSLPPTRQRLFRASEECDVFWKRRLILIINHTAHALKGMIPYFVLAFSRRRAKTIRTLVYVWSRNWEKLSVFQKYLDTRGRGLKWFYRVVGDIFLLAYQSSHLL